MFPFTPPMAVAVEVAAAQTTEADRATIAHLRTRDDKPLPDVAYLVKVRFETIPPATSRGWALYVNDYRVPKYWAYKDGVYFKVFDPQFFVDHQGHSLRFSLNGTDFIDTGLKVGLLTPDVQAAVADTSKLRPQTEALK